MVLTALRRAVLRPGDAPVWPVDRRVNVRFLRAAVPADVHRLLPVGNPTLQRVRRDLPRRGQADQVSFRLEDYRAHEGRYDAIASVEMIEAVGMAYWTDYLVTLDRLLAPGGQVALQVITYPHERMLASRRDYSWVDRYIFPGGALPSLRALERILGRSTSLEICQASRLSDSYSRTLREWRHRFLNTRDTVRGLGFDETFIRLWTLYFAYFEAGFRSRYCDVWQLALRRRPGSSDRVQIPRTA